MGLPECIYHSKYTDVFYTISPATEETLPPDVFREFVRAHHPFLHRDKPIDFTYEIGEGGLPHIHLGVYFHTAVPWPKKFRKALLPYCTAPHIASTTGVQALCSLRAFFAPNSERSGGLRGPAIFQKYFTDPTKRKLVGNVYQYVEPPPYQPRTQLEWAILRLSAQVHGGPVPPFKGIPHDGVVETLPSGAKRARNFW